MKYCLGVDLGGTNIAVGIVDLESRSIVRKFGAKTKAPRSCEEIALDIIKLCEDLCRSQKLSLSDMKWIGVATPGNIKAGVVTRAVNLGWTNADLGSSLRALTSLPVFLANDADSVAYAEALWGVGKGKKTVVAVTLGTGVGGGVVVDGKIRRVEDGFPTEIGHMIIDADGRRCPCGKRGCFEAYGSVRAFVSETRRMMNLYRDSLMWKLCGGDIMRVCGVTPFRAAEKGDAAAKAVLADYVKYLSIGISNVINLISPDVLCIGGGLSGEGENLIKLLREQIERMSFNTAKCRTEICVAKYMNDAGIIGGALLGKQEE